MPADRLRVTLLFVPESKLRILVIEKGSDTRQRLASVLGSEFELEGAESVESGLQLARKFDPSAVVVRTFRDELDGALVCQALKSDSATARTPVLVQVADLVELGRAFECGADDGLVAPFDLRELAARIKYRLLRGRGTDSGDARGQDALLELTRLLASSLDLHELLHLVAVRTADVLHVDRCAVVLFPPEGTMAQIVAASEDASVQDLFIQIDAYPEFQEVIRTRRPLVVHRVEDHPALKGILPTLVSKGIGSLALFPMVHDDSVDGLLFLRSERFQRALRTRDIFFANAVAAAVALALRNVRIANELKRTKQFFESVIDSSVDAIIAADMKGRVILFNKGAERMLGYRAEDVVGSMHVTKLYAEGVAHEVMQLLRGESNGGFGKLNTTRKEVVASSGERIPIELTAWMVVDDGKEVATAGIFTDLRERLRIERKLSQAQEQLMRSEQQAMIAELAGATAHELNQPLTSVMGYAEMARRKMGDAEAMARIIDIIISETERMAEIVRKIGRITRYETKSYVGGQRIVDLDRASEPD
ncbi:MAG: PAS domain S-box protein [Deltaproteobacteria bacterium]|nr:PAS domain S-box protein [Deltaproteobacteria bacterium]